METGLKRIAAKARCEKNLRFTSLCHHVTRERLRACLKHIPHSSAPGVDGITVEAAKESFDEWSDRMLRSIHTRGYKAPSVRRVWIPKPGKREKRPLAVPCVADRALQRAVSQVLSAVYEEDFLPCSFGGRPGVGAHHALATFHKQVMTRKVNLVLEADLKNFFGSLDHGWLLRFVEHRVGDPRILSLIRRWLKAGVMESGQLHPNEKGTPQGGSISVLLSNIYLHYVLDLWFEKVVKPRLKGEACLVRYLDDFVVCFQHRSDAHRFREALSKRLAKFRLDLEPSKTRLVQFGRFARERACERGRKPESIYFLGFTHFCTETRGGKFTVGRKTEKSRLRRSMAGLRVVMRRVQHRSLEEQSRAINRMLRGHYAYFGIFGNMHSLRRVYSFANRYWHRMLSNRSRKGYICWKEYDRLKTIYPLQRPKLHLPYGRLEACVVL